MCTEGIVILAVKPPSLPSLYKELQRYNSRKQIGLVVSICAGTKLKNLEQNVSNISCDMVQYIVIATMVKTAAVVVAATWKKVTHNSSNAKHAVVNKLRCFCIVHWSTLYCQSCWYSAVIDGNSWYVSPTNGKYA